MERKVVITGLGIWSCLGHTLDDVRDALYAGKSGIVFNPMRKAAGFRSALCASVEEPDLKPFVSRNARQFMPEEARYAYMATRSALEHARLDPDYIGKYEVGLVYGNDSVAESTMRSLDRFREFGDTSACGSGAIFQSMNSTVTMNLACLFRLRGINLTSSAACASGSQAVGLAYLLVRDGLQDCVVCGGAQETNLYGVAAFDGIQSFSSREDEPTKASRPFDASRDGLVPGGGAATLVVESYEPVLYVCPCAHFGGAAHEDADLSGAYFGKQCFLFLIGVGVVDESYLVLRHATSNKFRAYVVINAETFAGSRKVAKQNLGQAVRFCVLPNLKHVVHTAVDLCPRLVWQQRVNYALVESELAPIVSDGEHVVHAGVNLPGVDFRRALGKFFYERLLYLRGLRHLVVVHDLRLR